MDLPRIARPPDVSTVGPRIDAQFDLATLLVGALFVLMVVALVAVLVQRRRVPTHDHGASRRAMAVTLAVALLAFLVVDGNLLARTFADLDAGLFRYPSEAEHPLRIELLAQQWSWNIRYPGPDGIFGTQDDITALNELHVPTGKPVLVRLRSKDVVHSFYLPNLRVKQDAIPGFTTQAWFQATGSGLYEIACAQHCGANHYQMRGQIFLDTPASFRAWETAAEADASRRWDPADREANWAWPWEER